MTKELSVQTEASSLLSMLERVASNPDADVTKLQALLNMQKEIMSKDAEMAFNQAMARLQPVLPQIQKEAKAHNSTYAKYDAIEKIVRPLYTNEGFSIDYNTKRNSDGTTTYFATINHVLGHSKTAEITFPSDGSGSKNPIQAQISSLSYAKRNLLQMLLNIVSTDDDDGNGANDVVTHEQAVEIDILISEVRADKSRFLKFIGAGDVQSIRAKDYVKAIQQLNAKKAAKK